MKIVYLIRGVFTSGGKERVICNKANWLARHGYDVTILTTDQKGRPSFYDFDRNIRMVDLGVDFADNDRNSFLKKSFFYTIKQRKYRAKLSRFLMDNRADIVVSTFGAELYWLPKLRDGSRKILEFHSSKLFRLLNDRRGLWRLWDRMRTRKDEKIVSKYDRFVVLTHEDKKHWGDKPNIEVIHNAASFLPDTSAPLTARKAIAVGRLEWEKGYDRMIRAWEIVHRSHPDWTLAVYGGGEGREALIGQIGAAGLHGAVALNPPTADIVDRYMESSLLVLSSRYEGLPMVLVEAMACGVPSVAFACKCGPRDIIQSGENGLLVEQGDVEGLAAGIVKLIEDDELRRHMGGEAKKRIKERFSERAVMRQWDELFKYYM